MIRVRLVDFEARIYQDMTLADFIALIGGGSSQTLAQTLLLGNDAGALPIVNMQNPTNDQDAATKNYVDSQVVATGNLEAVLTVGNDANGKSIRTLQDLAFIRGTNDIISCPDAAAWGAGSFGLGVRGNGSAVGVFVADSSGNNPLIAFYATGGNAVLQSGGGLPLVLSGLNIQFDNKNLKNASNPVDPQDVDTLNARDTAISIALTNLLALLPTIAPVTSGAIWNNAGQLAQVP